jgi:cell division protein FtsW
LSAGLILYVSSYLARKAQGDFLVSRRHIPFWCVVGVGILLLLRQPDFGGAVTLSATILGLLAVTELSLLHVGLALSGGVAAIVALVVWKPYRLARVMTFLNPWSDPQGRGFQIIQSLIAIGSGGIWGTGISFSRQKYFYLPMQHTDFIFPIIAEEAGLVGAAFVVLLFAAFVVLGARLALRMRSSFTFCVVLSTTLLTGLRAVVNLMMATGMIPTKGLGLPFVSYGGTALVVHLFLIGLVINCTRSARAAF